ncbi:hypothetical protein OKW35_001631 [Paraburkholderia sp. MM5477-R1]
MTRAGELDEIGALAGMASDGITAHRVAVWGYTNASVTGGRAWLSASSYERVSTDYLGLFED